MIAALARMDAPVVTAVRGGAIGAGVLSYALYGLGFVEKLEGHAESGIVLGREGPGHQVVLPRPLRSLDHDGPARLD
ncbi:MAG: hypothetical protein ABIU87_12465, partial [Ornithinibacter sp.]